MDSLLVITQIVALLAVSALCITLIVVLVRVRDLLTSVEKDVREIAARAIPVLENMEVITSRIRSITESLDDQVGALRESFASIRQIAENIVAFERRVQERVEGPVLEGVAFVTALLKGIRSFAERLRA
jgi:uncharacterized protein YoxC